MKKIKWSGDKLLGVSALIISLATLISLIYQARIMREHEMKSVFPKLELWNNRSDGKYSLTLVNTGVGPAMIEEVKVLYKDSLYDFDQAQFTRRYLDTLENLSWGSSNIPKGRIIQAGQTVTTLQAFKDSTMKVNPIEVLWGNDAATLIIKYSSVYEQKWKLEGTGKAPVLLDEEATVIRSFLRD